MLKLALISCFALGLAACSSTSAPDAATTAVAPAPASTAVPDFNPFKPLLNDRDKAKAVQQQVLDAAKQQQKAIEAAGG